MRAMLLRANFPRSTKRTLGLGDSLSGAAWGADVGARVTLDLDPGLGVTQGPDVHHHVHATRGKVLVVW